MTAQTIMKLNPMPPAQIMGGKIQLGEHDIIAASDKEMQDIRGKDVAMIFQDPMTCMNPTMQVGKQIVEAIKLHKKMSKQEAEKEAIRCLELVNIPNPVDRAKQYPHEFSGGMRQRAMIAMAVSCRPKLLIADEPTTALDVTIQAQILELMQKMKEEYHMSLILITHELGVIATMCTRVVVMYGGLIMEEGALRDIFYRTGHPYTLGLMESIPKNDKQRLIPIYGTPPDLLNPPKGCPFAARCKYAMKLCKEHLPELTEIGEGHRSACWLHNPCVKARMGEVKLS